MVIFHSYVSLPEGRWWTNTFLMGIRFMFFWCFFWCSSAWWLKISFEWPLKLESLDVINIEHIVSKGNHAQMAELFRLVNFYNLPRYIEIDRFRPEKSSKWSSKRAEQSEQSEQLFQRTELLCPPEANCIKIWLSGKKRPGAAGKIIGNVVSGLMTDVNWMWMMFTLW